jgi:hypothetical protein
MPTISERDKKNLNDYIIPELPIIQYSKYMMSCAIVHCSQLPRIIHDTVLAATAWAVVEAAL